MSHNSLMKITLQVYWSVWGTVRTDLILIYQSSGKPPYNKIKCRSKVYIVNARGPPVGTSGRVVLILRSVMAP